MSIVNENISLKELVHKENLSVSSSNVCGLNGLNDLLSILYYFWENNDFLDLRNCGSQSNTELIELCKKYEDFISEPKSIITENPIERQIDSLTVRQKKIFNNIIESQVNNLSVRCFNVINKFSGSNLTIRGLKEILLDPNYDLGKLKNIGKKSNDELIQFFKELREHIEIIELFENEDELSIELFNSVLRRRFCISPNDIDKLWKDYNVDNGIPIFKTIDILISNGYLFENKEKEIFKRGFNFWTSSETEKLEGIAASLGITKERTRQIRKKMLDDISSSFSFLNTFEFDALNIYGIDRNADIISVDENLIEEIQQKENVCFNNFFVTKIFSILLNKTHSLVGNLESCVLNVIKPKGISYRWNSIYLVKNEIVESFNFESLLIDVQRRLSERIDEDYSFHFETYLKSFMIERFEINSFAITQIAEHIIFNEFEISIDTFDQVTFKRNTKKQVVEYVYDILKEKKEPLDIYQIYNILISKHPNVTKNAEALRGSCQRTSKLIFFGRSSTYGLREWEKDDLVKGGTMHDIAEEFLLQYNEPKYIDEITEYVYQYRPEVTSKNLLYNLKSAENRRFRFFKNSHIGLISKKYDTSYELNNKNYGTRRSWDYNYAKLHKFCIDNGRLPLASAIYEERKLYDFMNVQRNSIKKAKLSEDKVEKIEGLLLKYPVVRKRSEGNGTVANKFDNHNGKGGMYNVSNRWWESYKKLLIYLEKYNTYPTALKERSLYTFCYNCKKRLEAGNLHPSQREALEKMNFNFGTERINSWNDNFNELKAFKAINDWPKCIESDKLQIKLYRFCISLFKAYKNEVLTKAQLDKLDEINFPYKLGFFTNKWLVNYEKLKKFRKKNPNVWPKARGGDLEKPLYQFCYRNKNKFIDGTLEEYKIQLLNDINFDFYE